MLQHVEQGDHVVTVGREHAEVGQSRFDHGPAEPFAGELPRNWIELARLDLAEARQHCQVVSGSSAELEDPGMLRWPDVALDHAVEDSAPGGEPPMGGVELRHLFIDLALHQSPICSRTT